MENPRLAPSRSAAPSEAVSTTTRATGHTEAASSRQSRAGRGRRRASAGIRRRRKHTPAPMRMAAAVSGAWARISVSSGASSIWEAKSKPG